jgi:hypothetical protein
MPDDHPGFRTFQTRVASSDADGYTPYWLGRTFVAGGLVFEGPYVPRQGDEVQGGGVEFTYQAATQGGKGLAVLSVLEYSTEARAWAERFNGLGRFGPDATLTRVLIDGASATMAAIPAGDRPVNQRRLLVEMPGATVLIIALAGGSPTPGGADTNPLIDEATFLAAVKNLRPYPE